jgi:hypothetical protein
MSELAPGAVSLEDDNPSLETLAQPTPEAPAQTEPTAPQANAEDAEPEGTVVNPGGEKLVPLNVVADLRGKVRESKSALEAKEQEIAALREKATKYDQVAGEWQAAQPLIQQLRNGTYQPPAAQQAQVNAKAVEYAKYLDLYKADGTPDVDRAQKILDHNAALARETAQQIVAPIYQQTAQTQSANNFEQAANFKDKNGLQVDRGILQQIWSQVPPELSSQPGVASVLWRQAVAETVMAGKWKPSNTVTPPAQPVFTESLGTTSAPRPELSHVDRGLMQAASIGAKDYEKISANFKPGQRNELE